MASILLRDLLPLAEEFLVSFHGLGLKDPDVKVGVFLYICFESQTPQRSAFAVDE